MRKLPEKDRRRPAANQAPSKLSDDDTTIVAQALDVLPHMTHRLLQEALSDAWAPQQRARAAAFRAAAPRPGDFHGRATREELRAAWERCRAIAGAFENRAELCPTEVIATDVATALGEVA